MSDWRTVVVSALLLSSAVHAQNRFPDGFLGTDPSSVRGVYVPSLNDVQRWVDGRYLVYRSFGANFGDNCFDMSDGGVSKLGPTAYFTLLAGNADAGTLVGLTVTPTGADLYRVACGRPAVLLGAIALPEALQPKQGVATLSPDETSVVYVTSTGLARLSLSPSFSVTELASKADVFAAFGPDAGLPISVPVGQATTAPNGHVFFTATLPSTGGGAPPLYVLDLPPGGQVRKRLGPYTWKWGASVAYLPELGAAVAPMNVTLGLGGDYAALAILPSSGPEVWTSRVPPFPALHSELAGFVPGRGGLYAQVPGPGGNVFERYVFRPQFADFDRDGLSLLQEQDAGTSDLLPDSDRDGFNDGYETRIAHTDPTSAASAPLVTDRGAVLAASGLGHYGFDLLNIDSRYGTSGFVPRICDDDFCFDSTGTVTRFDVRAVNWMITPDAGAAWYEKTDNDWRVRDLTTATDRVMARPPGTLARMIPIPFDGTAAIVRDPGDPIGTTLRLGATDWFPVVQRSRSTCPVLPTAADVPRCESFARVPVLEQRPVGYDPATGMALVMVFGTGRSELYGVGKDSAVQLADLTEATGGWGVGWVRHLPTGGWVVGGTDNYSVLLDEAFRVTGRAQSPIEFPSDLFRIGLAGRQFGSYLIERGARSNDCGSFNNGKGFVCDSMFGPPDARYLTFAWFAEWVPMLPDVKPGEVVGWAARFRRDGVAGGYRAPPGFVGDPPRWMVMRIGREGGVLPWLDWFEFAALLPRAQRDSIDPSTLGTVTSIQASSDGLAFCFSEPAARRTWELTLDPTTRRAASARLASTTSGAGCAYTVAGELVLLETGPATLVIGANRIALPGLTKPTSVSRFESTWVVTGDREPARCVRSDGSVHITSVKADGLTNAFGAVAYIDEKGVGLLSPLETFCAGGEPTEVLIARDANVWTYLYNPRFTSRSANSHGAAMAVRPDGLMYLSPRAISYFENEAPTETAPAQLFHVFPTYAPTDWSRRTRSLDPLRLVDAIHDVADPKSGDLTALALVPGADGTGGWGPFKRPGTLLTEPVDAGSLEPEPEPGSKPAPGTCSCSGVGSGLLALGVLVLGTRRRRGTAKGP